MKNFSTEQEKAIAHTGRSALVSAAAGSGKTAVLVERVVRLLVGEAEETVHANKIVLVTFTKKAATEMRERLIKELRKKPETPLIHKQLIRLEEAQITTINAFCLNLLHENSGFVGLEPGFCIADDEEIRLLSKKAMAETLEEFYDYEPSEIEPVMDFFTVSGSGSDSALQQAILDLFTFTRNIPDSENWLNEQIDLYENPHKYQKKVVPEFISMVEKALSSSNTAYYKKKNKSSLLLVPSFCESVEKLCPVIKMLVRLYKVYCERFTQIKRGKKVIDFSDCEHLCLKLLQKNSKVSKNYELIIVDEFQDSNFLQYELFKLLDNGRSILYMVGDIRQSIYRFRGADSAVFDKVSQSEDYEVLHLSRNFRSSNQVVEGVNSVFADWAPLKAGKGIDKSEYSTELILLDENHLEKGKDGLTAEATYTARRIKKMVYDGEFTWGDFAVLTSAGEKNLTVYEKVFREHDVPCVSAGGGGYLKTEEIGLALDLLMVINNPYNDLSLFNIMMSPLFNFTAEEMAVIREGNRKTPLFSAVLKSESENAKTKAFLKTIERYRKIAEVSPVAELISVMNGEKLFLPLTVDNYKSANIQLLSYYAEKFSVMGSYRSNSSLSSFLSYIKELKNIDIDVRQANVNSQAVNSVRLMTIHASKGLEFPVCFVGRVNQEFNFRGSKSTALISFDKEAGIVSDCRSSIHRVRTLLSDYAERINRNHTIDEELRKLYVASTRAECKLIYTGFSKNGKIKDNSYASWLIDNVALGETKIPDVEAVGIVGVQTEKIQEIQTEEKQVETKEYPRKALATVPKKLTATQVGVVHDVKTAGNEYDEPTVFPRNPSFYGEKRLTGKKRGDAYHKVMAGEKLTELEEAAVDFSDIERFWKSPLGIRAGKSEKIEKEYKLYTQVDIPETEGFPDKVFVQGIADMFFYENNSETGLSQIILVDYKTNRNTTAEKLIHDYKGQLLIYKKAIEEMTGVQVKECWLYSFELGGVQLTINN
jgi:ATP-dependent helicase/nuclease subunit A